MEFNRHTTWHFHGNDFSVPFDGERCEKCPPSEPGPAMKVVAVDHATRTITIGPADDLGNPVDP